MTQPARRHLIALTELPPPEDLFVTVGYQHPRNCPCCGQQGVPSTIALALKADRRRICVRCTDTVVAGYGDILRGIDHIDWGFDQADDSQVEWLLDQLRRAVGFLERRHGPRAQQAVPDGS